MSEQRDYHDVPFPEGTQPTLDDVVQEQPQDAGWATDEFGEKIPVGRILPKQPQEYDDLLPVCLHEDKLGQWHLLDRHNDEIATFDPAIELDDMQRIVTSINQLAAADNATAHFRRKYNEVSKLLGKANEQLAAERTSGEAWRLVAKGKEGAYVKMERELIEVRDAARLEQARDDRKHYEAQQRPLMDALDEMAQSVPLHPKVLDALAKVKEGKRSL